MQRFIRVDHHRRAQRLHELGAPAWVPGGRARPCAARPSVPIEPTERAPSGRASTVGARAPGARDHGAAETGGIVLV
eukprot:6482834-Prymnesium_polylepis.1